MVRRQPPSSSDEKNPINSDDPDQGTHSFSAFSEDSLLSVATRYGRFLESLKIDFANRMHTYPIYAMIVLMGVIAGVKFASAFRGLPTHATQLMIMTPAFIIPSVIVSFLLLTLYVRLRAPATIFMVMVILFVNIALLVQWPFYSYGRTVLGQIDFENARRICEVNRDRVMVDEDSIRLHQVHLVPAYPDGRAIDPGIMGLPGIYVFQNRIMTRDRQLGTIREKIENTVVCRVFDRRTDLSHDYNYATQTWGVARN